MAAAPALPSAAAGRMISSLSGVIGRAQCRSATIPISPYLISSKSPRHQTQLSQRRRRCFSTQSQLLEKKYTQDHEWIDLSEDSKTGTIGITTYASKSLGDVVYVELPTLDLEVKKGDTIGAVESVKSASDIMTPISGKITEVNNLLGEKPGTINKGPEAEGWLARIAVGDGDRGEMDGLMTKVEYDGFVEGEGEAKE